MSKCKYCNKDFFDKRRPNGSQCNSCHLAKRRWKKKLHLVSLLGGRCSRCGYDKNIGALHFHHVRSKNFSLNTRSIEYLNESEIQKELKKCVILCANCHAEEHCLNYNKFEKFYNNK